MAETTEPAEALAELAAGALRGPEQAAWMLFERAWPRVVERLATFQRSLGVPEESMEDCGQAVLVRVWRFRTRYRGGSVAELAGWMYSICRNEWARLLAGRGAGPSEGGADVLASLPTGEGDPTTDPVEGDEALRALEECLGTLGEKQRSVVELLYAPEPLTEREVEQVLGISKSYVNDLRREALKSLARCLTGKGVEG